MNLKKDIVRNMLRDGILGGKYTPGQKLPPETDLAKELNVGKVTLRSALETLEQEGLIARVHGKGTFVSQTGGGAGKTRILAIVDRMDAFENPTIHILEGLREAALENALETLTFERPYIECMSPAEFKSTLEAEKVLGVAAMMSFFHGREKILDILRGGGRPVVLPHAMPSDASVTGFATINIEQRAPWVESVEHLAGNGHQRVASIIHATCPDIRGHSIAEFKELLSKNGLSLDDGLIRFLPYERETTKGAVKELMSMSNPPTAILCYSDYFAIFVYEALRELGLRIPEDVAVMGCCGYPGGALLNPPLSTTDYMYNHCGRLAVDVLVKSGAWFGRAGAAPPRLLVPHKFVARGSTSITRTERMFAS